MTTDRLTAILDACDLARKTQTAYVYKLRSGHYYISASPPGSFSAKYVASAYAEVPGDEPRVRYFNEE
jgi:hypothetical protein